MDLDVQPKKDVIVIDDDDDDNATEPDVEMIAAIEAKERSSISGGVLLRRMVHEYRSSRAFVGSAYYIEPGALTHETMPLQELLRCCHPNFARASEHRVMALLKTLVTQRKARFFTPGELTKESFTGKVQYDIRYDANAGMLEESTPSFVGCRDHVVWHVSTDEAGEETYIIPLKKFVDRPGTIGHDKKLGIVMGVNLSQFLFAVHAERLPYLMDYRIAARLMAEIEQTDDQPLLVEHFGDTSDDSAVILTDPWMVLFSTDVPTQMPM